MFIGSRPFWLLGPVLVGVFGAACGDDEDASGGGGSSPSSTSSSTVAVTSSTTSPSSTSASSSTGGGSCVAEDVLAIVSQFISAMDVSARLVSGHGFAGEAVAFLQAPGLPSPPALAGSFAGLFMPCSMPVLFDPFCEQGRCTRLECPGGGTDWINHVYLERPPLTAGDFMFDAVTLDVRWSDGSRGIAYDLDVESTGPEARVWNLDATGVMSETGWTLDGIFPSLLDAGEAALSVTDMGDEVTASLTVDGVVVADGVPLVATGVCP